MIGCTGKIAFATWTRADQTARKVRRKRDEVLEAYRCRQCGKYHVGHPTAESIQVRHRRRVGRVARRMGPRTGAEETDG